MGAASRGQARLSQSEAGEEGRGPEIGGGVEKRAQEFGVPITPLGEESEGDGARRVREVGRVGGADGGDCEGMQAGGGAEGVGAQEEFHTGVGAGDDVVQPRSGYEHGVGGSVEKGEGGGGVWGVEVAASVAQDGEATRREGAGAAMPRGNVGVEARNLLRC